MENLFDNILILLLFSSSASFLFLYFKSLQQLRSLTKATVDLFFKTQILEQTNTLSAEESQDIHKENFIKFLSDSRDWAFDYIDKSQKQIKEFIDIADKEFEFFDKYGILTEEQVYYESMKIISEEYKKLRILLPEEANDRREGNSNL